MKKALCKHHLKGNCRFGAACNFEHDATKAAAGALNDALKDIQKDSGTSGKNNGGNKNSRVQVEEARQGKDRPLEGVFPRGEPKP